MKNSLCLYNANSDQRRKIANQHNVQELVQTQYDLEHFRQLLGGIIAVFRAGSPQSTTDLVYLIRNDADQSTLAAFVRNEVRSTLALQHAFQAVDFRIHEPLDLPPPTQFLNRMEAYLSSLESEAFSKIHHNRSD